MMSDFEIRPATEADVPVLLALIKELAEFERLADKVAVSENNLRQRLFGEHPVADAVLGWCRDEPVAYAVFYPTFSTFSGGAGLYLEDLFVKKDYRARGYGGSMFRHVARLAKRRGFGKVSWAVLHWNKPAIDFYQHLGAKPAPQDWLVYTLDADAVTRLASVRKKLGNDA